MCTVSWVHSEKGYHLLCNRDEKKTRSSAIAPRIGVNGAVQFIAPVDQDFGGSWIAANEFGTSICLLNGYGLRQEWQVESRGLLVAKLSSAKTIEEVCARLGQMDLMRFASFTLVALSPGRDAALWSWDGSALTEERNAEHRMPLISSSFEPDQVAAHRQREFLRRVARAQGLDEKVLFDFHSSHGLQGNQPSPYSTCMHREDASTVSFSWVSVSAKEVSFLYTPAAPCQWQPREIVQLPRRTQ